GGIDLSVGSVIAFAGVFVAVMLRDTGLHPLIVFALLLAITTAFGAAMGALIHGLAMPAFIVTLAGMFLARGAAYMLTIDSVPINHPFYDMLDAYFRMPGGGRLTLIGAVMLLTVIAGMIIAHRTRFGTSVFALGGGEQTARLMGVSVGLTTVQIYAFSGFMAGLSGIVFSVYTSSGYPLATVGTELTAIATVVIGGTILTGGSGYVFGTLIGVLTMGLIQTYIVFDGSLSSWWTKIVIGMLLLLFILLQKGLLTLGQRQRNAPT
ncbi:galactofuranose ABC transporter, permease protein YjfF, partial [Loktanella sp. SALINAS62]|uniref:galactofuranose ABC transporter, permease protein YjfF n=1 Tax=Loktanella sp. SALINAS62 TaxID=2706124 RepID=UPI00201242FC